LASFLFSLALVAAAGSLLMFLVKGGTMAVLLAGERAPAAIELPPLRLATVRRASSFSLERFTNGARALFGRYTRLGLALAVTYVVSAALYFVVVFGPEPVDEGGWPLLAALASLALIGWIALVNFVYLLLQIVIAADDCNVRMALGRAAALFRVEGRMLLMVFGAILALVTMTTAASILATAALGLIAFVPLVGLAALPLQLFAWLLRGLVFQFIGLSGLVAYAHVHEGMNKHAGGAGAQAGSVVHRIGRTA
jgi:hypothetical protein